jgi:hypothetical protein
MLKIGKSILGAAMLAGLAATAVTSTQPASAAPVIHARGHWVHGWHGGRFGWWWAGPDWYWYPAPIYYDYPPPADYVYPAGPAPQPTWYYCDSAKGYYPYVQSCPGGWRAVAANAQPQTSAEPSAPPPAPGSSKL